MAVGHASVCWIPSTGDAVFDEAQATRVVNDLCTRIEEITAYGEARLGLATNAELFEEMIARGLFKFTGEDYDPNYRTVD